LIINLHHAMKSEGNMKLFKGMTESRAGTVFAHFFLRPVKHFA